MIKKLTKEQINQFPFYVDKWLKIGLSTDPCDREKAQNAAKLCYKLAGLKDPSIFIWANSPYECAIMQAILKNTKYDKKVRDQVWAQVRDQVGTQVGDQVRAQVWAQVRDQVRDQVWAQVWAQVGDQVRAQVRDQVRDQVWAQVWAQVGDQVRAQVRDQVWAQVWAQVGDQVRDQVRDQVYGCHDSGWLSFYYFFKEEFNLECTKKLDGLFELAQNCGWWAPYETVCFLQEKPSEIHLVNKRLHNETGPSVLYRDGFSVYCLNGVRVTKEIVETPKEKLSCDLILSEKNAQTRTEIVKKIGTNRIFKDLGSKTIDQRNSYDLVTLDLKDGRHRPYLKMVNPSTGEIHIEGVHPDCKTVLQALAWRNNLDKWQEPEVLT